MRAEHCQVRGYEAAGDAGDADASGHGGDEAVDPAADAHVAVGHPGLLEGDLHGGTAQAGAGVDDERNRPLGREAGVLRTDPDQPFALDQPPALLAGRTLAQVEVELVVLQPPVQRPALVDGQVQLDQRVVPTEVAQDLRQPGEGQVVGHAQAQPPARLCPGEETLGLPVRGEDRLGEADHRLAVGGQRHRVGVAQDQVAAGRLLELADVLADGGLPDAEPCGRLGEAAGLRNGKEGLQLSRVVRHRYLDS